ncbi:MAG TPA: GNAT family N-acetyltransferase [Mycobacteriales bacterium]|nr:GNAT family N-acetyltransferase [Mycobacteriales bacterium]
MTGLLERPATGTVAPDPIRIRPAGAADRDAVHRFLAGLSLDSAYRRFFTGIGSPAPTLTRRLVEVDHDRRETLLALRGADVIGLADSARLAPGSEVPTVELGVVVADAWQRRGLGPRLARALLERAVLHGARAVRVHALADNTRVSRMLHRRWPDTRPVREDGVLVWHLPLT